MDISLSNRSGRQRLTTRLPADILDKLPGGGVSGSSFLSRTLDNRVDSSAPYPALLNGVDTLELHKLVRTVVTDNQETGKPVTLNGLAQGYQTLALQSLQASRTKETAAEVLRSRPLGTKFQEAVSNEKSKTGERLKAAGRAALHMGLVGVGLAGVTLGPLVGAFVYAGGSIDPLIPVALTASVSGLLSALGLASGLTLCVTQGLEGIRDSMTSHKPLQAEAAQLRQSAVLQGQMAGQLQQWDNTLGLGRSSVRAHHP